MAILPDAIIEEILSRSDVKSLLRFKSVCHAWKTTISDPIFVKSHAKRKNSKKLMLCYPNCSTYSVSASCNGEEKVVVENITNKFDDNSKVKYGDDIDIVGSCNGLMLVAIFLPTYQLSIWNPSTREYKELPTPATKKHIKNGDSVCGLGYASSADDYKVVLINSMPVRHDALGHKRRSYEVLLYSTHMNSWKKMIDVRYSLKLYNSLLLVNAKLHCPAKKSGIILAFDIEDEEFKEIAAPDNIKDSRKCLMKLNGNLCIYSRSRGETKKVFLVDDERLRC